MKIDSFLRLSFTFLVFLSLSVPLCAGGSKDKVSEEEKSLEPQLEEVQESNQDLENEASLEESSLEEGAEVIQGSENENLQEDVSESTQNLENESSQEAASQESDTVEEGPPVPQLIKDGKGKPRLHLFDGEETSILSTNTSKTLVTKADGNFTRILYDDEYRLQSRLIWKEGDTSLDEEKTLFTPSQIRIQEDYFYYDNSRNRQRVVLTNFEEVSRKESFYSLEGLLVKEEMYHFVPNEDDEKKDKSKDNQVASKKDVSAKETSEKENPKSQKNEENQEEDSSPNDVFLDPRETFPTLTLVQTTEYQYNQDKALTEKKITQYNEEGNFIQKTVYHSPGNLHGGFDYFENGQLLISRKYEDESRYTETRFFDTMKVETLYSGSRLLAEVVYLDGKELRRTEY